MKHIFMDTNVVIDLLADRKPFSLDAARLFNLAMANKTSIYVSAVSYSNIYYILRKTLAHSVIINLLEEIASFTEITTVTDVIIRKSLKTNFKDYEDAIQYYCALSIPNIDFIVTRNDRDFKKSILPVLTPSEAIVLLGREL